MADYGTFAEVRARLDQILAEVRKKDLSLEKSLDLYEEAIALGNRCAELVDKPDFSPEELDAMASSTDEEEPTQADDGAQAFDEEQEPQTDANAQEAAAE